MHLGPEAERIVLPILQQNQISEIVFTKYQKWKIIQRKKDNKIKYPTLFLQKKKT